MELIEYLDAVYLAESAKRNIHHKKFGGYGIVDRVRGGKVQTRVKKSERKGYKIKDGRLTRMSFAEIRNRKIAARISVKKRRAKQMQANRKRTVSLRIRKRRFGA